MNVENLKRAQEYIQTIPKNQFSMASFRKTIEDSMYHQCGTVGCIIGWCTILDKPINVEKFRNVIVIDEKTNEKQKLINFTDWSEKFFGIKCFVNNEDVQKYMWDYLFSGIWARHEETNSVDHAVYRIQRILDGYKPDNMYYLDELKRLNLDLVKK